MKHLIFMLICATLSARRGEFINSTGADGKFHLSPLMYLCLNFTFDPGPDPRSTAHLNGELLFSGIDGNTDLDKADGCTPVTERMIKRQNSALNAIDKVGGMKPGESRTLTTK